MATSSSQSRTRRKCVTAEWLFCPLFVRCCFLTDRSPCGGELESLKRPPRSSVPPSRHSGERTSNSRTSPLRHPVNNIFWYFLSKIFRCGKEWTYGELGKRKHVAVHRYSRYILGYCASFHIINDIEFTGHSFVRQRQVVIIKIASEPRTQSQTTV